MTKTEKWERKLLDIGLRNTLINLRMSRRLVPLYTPSLDELEDGLFDGKEYALFPRPLDWHIEAKDIGFENMHDTGPNAEWVASEFGKKRLHASQADQELTRSLKELYRAARSSLEENGANTLFLAMGILRWQEAGSSVFRYAPLILLPVELVRRFGNLGYLLRLREEEPQLNITLFEKLKQDFSIHVEGLDTIPQDEHGIDTREIFRILRKITEAKKEWEILESAYLGIFSFSQFVMWNDLKNRTSDLERNPLVRSLIDGKLAWDAKEMKPEDKVSEEGVYLPLPADASQLFAIKEAAGGESFVLHGPPGTGKSQTITALICNALAKGKTVLFVAEKMAALEVVQKRLDKVGIGPFCLELHSNRSRKRDVLDQLKEASEITACELPEAYAKKAEEIAEVRRELDAYAEELHRKRDGGLTLYTMISRYEDNKDAEDLPREDAVRLAGVPLAVREKQETVIERLRAAGEAARTPGETIGDHPLGQIGTAQYSQTLRLAFPDAVRRYRESIEGAVAADAVFSGAAGMPAAATRSSILRRSRAADALLQWGDLPRAWAKEDDPAAYFAGVRQMAEEFGKAAGLKEQVLQSWNESFLKEDASALLRELGSIQAKWVLPRAFGMNAFVKRLQVFHKGKVEKEGLEEQFSVLSAYRDSLDKAEKALPVYGNALGSMYRGEDTDWQSVIGKTEQAEKALLELDRTFGSTAFRMRCCGVPAVREAAAGLKNALDALFHAENEADRLLELKISEKEGWPAEEIRILHGMEANADSLKEWVNWNSAAKEAEEAGLSGLVHAYENGLPAEHLKDVYRKALYRELSMKVIDEVPVLSRFSGVMFHELVDRYRKLDEEIEDLAGQEIYCILSSRVPNFTREASRNSEVGILQKAIRSGGRGMSIRRLFELIPTLLPRLCPCMLMSPISAAQYLDPGREPFDIVVFDEASQLQTCKAVGAIARGRSAVIVGDPNQMPPTTFFMADTFDEEDPEEEDLESILDDCLALNMPGTHLLWHYRSRHESLIAFSNSQFYDGRLYTFPSVDERKSMVSLVAVNGIFDRGGSRTNPEEARAILQEVIERAHDPQRASQSVGIVTFNIQQQNLVEDLLNEACAKDPELEKWAYGAEEPIFIKNLESVQGDERDVILFSVSFAKDKTGKMQMNFGPLNRDGGWRRLNVAVTRARQEMKVFTSITPEDIDLSLTSARGVAALKSFLAYAAGRTGYAGAAGDAAGNAALPEGAADAARGKMTAEGIAAALQERLAEAGYASDVMVGHSRYRVDLAVLDPEDPEKYLLGILLDGAGYAQAGTTRDREIAQMNVLSGLGWPLMRIYSMDWWDNADKEFAAVLKKIEEVREENAEKKAAQEIEALQQAAAGEMAAAEDMPAAPDSAEPGPAGQEGVPFGQPAALAGGSTGIPVYEAAEPEKMSILSSALTDVSFRPLLQERIRLILEKEAPVTEDLIFRRLLRSLDIERSGSRIRRYLEDLLRAEGYPLTVYKEQRVYWRKGQDPDSFRGFRRQGENENRREVRDIPIAEAKNAVVYLLEQEVALDDDSLIRESAKIMGLARITQPLVILFRDAVAELENEGRIRRNENDCRILA